MKIVKLGYSRSPWRIVNDKGLEVATVCSVTGIQGAVSGDTKQEVVDWLLDRFEWYAMHAKWGVTPAIYSAGWRKKFEDRRNELATATPPVKSHD